ncbi:MAG: ATP-binding protein [Oligoflexales bacterium]
MIDNEKLPEKSHINSIFFAFFCILPIAIVLYVFYGEELRLSLENDLFDIRTRIKPQTADTSRVAVVTISQQDIATIEQENAQVPKLSSIRQIIDACFLSNPEAVALVIPRHDVDYDSAEFDEFLRILNLYPNLYLGTFDLNYRQPTGILMPTGLMSYPDQEFGSGTIRTYRREVTRTLPLMSYREDKLVPHLMNEIAQKYSNQENKQSLKQLNFRRVAENQQELSGLNPWNPDPPPVPNVKLNFVESHIFLTVNSVDLLANGVDQRLTGRIVVIGYTAYRRRTYANREGTHVNTPWEGDGNPEVFGTPFVYVLAVLLQNLLEGAWLSDAPFKVNMFQTLAISIISFFVWRMPPFLAVSLFGILLVTLTYIHSILFAIANIHVPLADTLLFAILSTIAGAFVKAHFNSRQFVKREGRAKAKKNLAIIQSRFLNRFSFELYENNKQIRELLAKHTDSKSVPEVARKVFSKALGSCEELGEYLFGIKQYASLREDQGRTIRKQSVELNEMLAKVLGLFESLIEEQGVRIAIECPVKIFVFTDKIFLEPILFNLISNAIKYSPKDGEVTLRVVDCSNNQVKIEVIDQGPGIALEFQKKIFEKFYRVKNDQVYKVKGNGLGLYLCHYFAKRIGIRVELVSEVGKGANFSLVVERCRD